MSSESLGSETVGRTRMGSPSPALTVPNEIEGRKVLIHHMGVYQLLEPQEILLLEQA